jgi:hypothetical protein
MAPEQHNFEHLPLLRRYDGPARLHGGGNTSEETKQNRNSPQAHSARLLAAARSFTANWQARKAQRQEQSLPVIQEGAPILLKLDPYLDDVDLLRQRFSFEIVGEQEDGYVIVASEDIEIASFIAMIEDFAGQIRGSAIVAQVHKLFDDPDQTDRLGRILSERLMSEWGSMNDEQVYIVDVGIACAGIREIPGYPERGKRTTDARWEARKAQWSRARDEAYQSWDEIKTRREDEITQFASFYEAEILHLIDGAEFDAGVLPDSFTVRLKIIGKGLRDFVLNYPYIFEVVEPEDIVLPQIREGGHDQAETNAAPVGPLPDAPAVCVIDSGIQERHVLIQPAVDQPTSHCFLPGKRASEVGDEVSPGGHGTRVAGAVLYGEVVARSGAPQLPFWIQNGRVLDQDNRMPEELFPPEAIRSVVRRFHEGARHTRIFNHSINAQGCCRTRYMSAWAAEIDMLCAENDILVVQSAGNIPSSGRGPYPGIEDHLAAGRDYPLYLHEASARIASPGQSFQALTVGSVAYGAYTNDDWHTFAREPGHPSAFSRCGPGIWNVIKPEVVEYGGDSIRTNSKPPDVQAGGGIPSACPELVRATMFAPGPAYDRDETGTSFAAPKVARIAARLQQLFPEEPALLYRALIVQSAQWPTWAEAILDRLRTQTRPAGGREKAEREDLLGRAAEVIRCIGYGIPDETRATANTEHRTTLITNGKKPIRARECHVYQVPIPMQMRRPADEFDIRIDITLSYVAKPRRTRRHLRHYLSTRVDWITSKLGEGTNDFLVRALKDIEIEGGPLPGSVLPWTLQGKPNDGFIRGIKRNSGTVQKDWAVVKSNQLPDQFCIAVRGHPGWSRDPDSTARYALAVTFEILGQEISIYEPLRTAVIELQTEIEAAVETEVEIESQ